MVQFIGSLEELNVHTITGSEGSQLLVRLPRPGDYLVTGYPITERGIIRSTLAHRETISVVSVPPTTSGTDSSTTVSTRDLTGSSDTSGTHSGCGHYMMTSCFFPRMLYSSTHYPSQPQLQKCHYFRNSCWSHCYSGHHRSLGSGCGMDCQEMQRIEKWIYQVGCH